MIRFRRPVTGSGGCALHIPATTAKASVTAPLHPPLQLRYTSVTAPPQSVTAPRHPPLQLRDTLRYSSVTPSVTASLQLRYSSVTAYDTAPLQLHYTLRYSPLQLRYSSATAPLQLRYSSATAPLQLRYSSVAPSVTAPLQPLLQLRYTLRCGPRFSSATAPLHPRLQLRYTSVYSQICNGQGPGCSKKL